MSTKAAKGKGKSRGGGVMSASQRHSRSRNTTPASNSALSADTLFSHDNAADLTYAELISNHSISDSSSIPTSAALSALEKDMRRLKEGAKQRSMNCDQQLRTLQNRIESRRAAQHEEEDRSRRGDDDRKDKVKRKKKHGDSDNKRPPAVGAHQATGQGMANDSVAQR